MPSHSEHSWCQKDTWSHPPACVRGTSSWQPFPQAPGSESAASASVGNQPVVRSCGITELGLHQSELDDSTHLVPQAGCGIQNLQEEKKGPGFAVCEMF